MRYTVIPAAELTSDVIERWTAIQQADFSLANPYFRPEFTQSVAAFRNDLWIGILENDRGLAGFFPFHRGWGGVARPVGLGLSDYHGVIAESGTQWAAIDLLRGCRLVRWEFDHLLASQRQFTDYHSTVSGSPIIDLSQGFAAYESSRDKSGRKQLKEIQRKREKLIERIGPLTFTLHDQDRHSLWQMMAWKSEQCRQTGTVDYFALPWCRQLVEQIHSAQTKDFGGILACLHAGDTLAAVHFAMYSREVWHSWFPAYNQDLEEFSPGMILLVEMIKAAAGSDIKHIDLGKGLSLYKKRVMTGTIAVAQGCMEIPSFRNQIRHMKDKTEQWSRQSVLRPVLRIPGRVIKSIERKKRYE